MTTFEQVKAIIIDTLKCDEENVVLEANITSDLGADSLDVVDLVMALEDAFGVAIDSDKVSEIITVGDIVTVIDALK